MFAGTSQQATASSPPIEIFREFERYPFSDDPDFKAGLPTVIAAIRGKERTAAQIDEMIGRAQWFYYTRIRQLNIPWEAYAQYSKSDSARPYPTPSSSGTASLSRGSSPAGISTPPGSGAASRSRPSPPAGSPLSQLNNLAEAKKMMAAKSSTQGDEGAGMSFAMLCRLISEGRAAEVTQAQGQVEVIDAINTAQPSLSTLPPRPKPWQTAGLNVTLSPDLDFTPAGSPVVSSPMGFPYAPGRFGAQGQRAESEMAVLGLGRGSSLSPSASADGTSSPYIGWMPPTPGSSRSA